MLSIYRAGEIDLFENLDIVNIRLLVERETFINTKTALHQPSQAEQNLLTWTPRQGTCKALKTL